MSFKSKTTKQSKRQPLEIQFVTVNKPDAKKAAKLLGPILYQMLKKERLAELSKND